MAREANTNGTLNAYVANGIDVQSGDRFGYKIVAIVYSEHFWAAYRGLTDWSDSRCADSGDKISYDVARELFPTINAVIDNYNY